MDVLETIGTRRSIRRYRADPVDDRVLELVLEAARWAPSWDNTQCWRFIIVKDTAIKEKLADTLIGISGETQQVTSGEAVPTLGKGIVVKPNRAAAALRQAPVAIVACAELGKSGYYRKEPGRAATDKGDWYMFDVALAMQNFTLAAHALGLGTVYVGAFDAGKAASILEVPPGFTVVAMTPLGYPDEAPTARTRKGLTEIAFHDRFCVS